MVTVSHPEAVNSTAPAAKGKQRRRTTEAIPTLAEARKRLAAARGRPQPWLSPEALAAYPEDVPLLLGPLTYNKDYGLSD